MMMMVTSPPTVVVSENESTYRHGHGHKHRQRQRHRWRQRVDNLRQQFGETTNRDALVCLFVVVVSLGEGKVGLNSNHKSK